MSKISKKNLLKGVVRVNLGFSTLRSYSMGEIHPKKTSTHLGEWLYKKAKKK